VSAVGADAQYAERTALTFAGMVGDGEFGLVFTSAHDVICGWRAAPSG
jgi:hypothetical protein